MEDNKETIIIEENHEPGNSKEVTSLASGHSETTDKREKEEKQIEFKLDNLNLSKSNIINILEDLRIIKKRFNHIENIIREAERAQYGPSRDLPGITGIYDGEFMVAPDGVKHEVPKNYAAKSLLVNGDELKMMEQDGKFAFKIVKKVPRKKIEGLLSKKDGRYVILAENASYNLLKTAVEFRNIKQGEWVLAVIPETGTANNFAAIDKVIKKETKKEVKFYDKSAQPKPQPKPDRSNEPKPNQNQTQAKPHNTPSQPPRPQQVSSQPKKEETPKPSSPMPKIQFSDDDLV